MWLFLPIYYDCQTLCRHVHPLPPSIAYGTAATFQYTFVTSLPSDLKYLPCHHISITNLPPHLHYQPATTPSLTLCLHTAITLLPLYPHYLLLPHPHYLWPPHPQYFLPPLLSTATTLLLPPATTPPLLPCHHAFTTPLPPFLYYPPASIPPLPLCAAINVTHSVCLDISA